MIIMHLIDLRIDTWWLLSWSVPLLDHLMVHPKFTKSTFLKFYIRAEPFTLLSSNHPPPSFPTPPLSPTLYCHRLLVIYTLLVTKQLNLRMLHVLSLVWDNFLSPKFFMYHTNGTRGTDKSEHGMILTYWSLPAIDHPRVQFKYITTFLCI